MTVGPAPSAPDSSGLLARKPWQELLAGCELEQAGGAVDWVGLREFIDSHLAAVVAFAERCRDRGVPVDPVPAVLDQALALTVRLAGWCPPQLLALRVRGDLEAVHRYGELP